MNKIVESDDPVLWKWREAALLKDRTRDAIRQRHAAGESVEELAKDYGVPESFVHHLCAWQLGRREVARR